jgi:hypothetical protein
MNVNLTLDIIICYGIVKLIIFFFDDIDKPCSSRNMELYALFLLYAQKIENQNLRLHNCSIVFKLSTTVPPNFNLR